MSVNLIWSNWKDQVHLALEERLGKILKVLSYHSSVGGYLVAQLLVWFPNQLAASKSDGDPVYEVKLQLFKV